MSDRPTYIYALCEPGTEVAAGELPPPEMVRYVGKAIDPRVRFNSHVKTSRGTSRRFPVHKWIANRMNVGLRPVQIIIEETGEEWAARETFWIAHYRAVGARLLSLTDGGEGASNPSPETLAKRARAISLALMGKKFTPERSAKMSLIRKGKKPTAAAIAIRTAGINKTFSDPERVKKRNAAIAQAYDEKPERREAKRAVFVANWERPGEHERASEERKQRWANPEYKAKVTATLNSPENKARNSQATTARWLDPEWRARVLAAQQAGRERKKAERG